MLAWHLFAILLHRAAQLNAFSRHHFSLASTSWPHPWRSHRQSSQGHSYSSLHKELPPASLSALQMLKCCLLNPTVRICLSRKLSKIHRLTVEILHMSRTIHGLTMGPESSRCHCLSMLHFHPFKMGIAYIACADVPHQLTQRGMDIESVHSKLSSLQVSWRQGITTKHHQTTRTHRTEKVQKHSHGVLMCSVSSVVT